MMPQEPASVLMAGAETFLQLCLYSNAGKQVGVVRNPSAFFKLFQMLLDVAKLESKHQV